MPLSFANHNFQRLILPGRQGKITVIENFEKDNNAIAKKNDKWGVIDKNNRIVISFEYDTIYKPGIGGGVFDEHGFAIIMKEGKEGLIDKNNRIKLPCVFEIVSVVYSDGYFSARGNNGKYGIVDKNGQTIIPFMYEKASPFHQPLDGIIALVWKDGKAYAVDKNNKIVSEIKM